ncbi:hypothetical protein EW146_g4749 [Bondarzewia mesenterica]|uniref:DUF6534 domain-containing protein n=1 Tax=Bondarzewia mesenterica TaxID=1095465 RepID=A0A4V3XF13_9AGAM|nr:hypothetical protein EW146_g4749 [Bondarzewia mesenterica]
MPSETALNTTLGPFLLGYTAVAILFGITNVQAFMYCLHCWKRDSWKLRSFVLLLWFIDALQMALTGHCVYYYLILKFGDLENIVTHTVVWSLTDIGDFLVRTFYCQRLWKLDNKFRVLAIVAWLAYLNTSAIVFSDTVIAVSLCYCLSTKAGLTDFSKDEYAHEYLRRAQSHHGAFRPFDSIKHENAHIYLQFAARPHTFIFIAFFLLLSKLYFNAMLANLNARARLRETASANTLISIPLSNRSGGRSESMADMGDVHVGSTHKNTPMQVHMSVDRVTASDSKIHGSDDSDV